MKEENERIFTLLEKSLSKKGEDYFISSKEIISFYKKHKVEISDRLSREILVRLYPDLPPKVKKDRFLARKIIAKFLLYDLSSLSLEDALEEYHLEKIEKNLTNKNISFSREVVIELVKESLAENTAKWTTSDANVGALAVNEKMKDTLSHIEFLSNNFNTYKEEESQFRLTAMDTLLRGFSTFTKTNGTREFNKKLMSFKADIEIEKLKASLSREDQEFLESKITYMKATANVWVHELYDFNGRTFVAKGGRGGSKSYEIAKFLIIKALEEKNSIFLCVRETRNVISDSSLAVLKRVIADFDLERFFTITTHTLSCSLTNSYFIFKGTKNPENTLKSLENVKYVWIDEAQLISLAFWQVLNPTIRRDDSLIIATYNPKSEKDPVYLTYVKEVKATTKILDVNYIDNAYLPKRLKEERVWDKSHMSLDDYKHIWEGEFLKYSDSLVFKDRFFIEETPSPEDEEEEIAFYYGADWGDKDPTAIVRCWIHPLRNEKDWELIIDRSWWARGARQQEIAEGIKEVLGEDTEGIVRGDTNETKLMHYLREEGFNMRTAKKGAGSISDGLRLLKSFKRIVIHPDCKRVIDEFNTYKYKTDPLTQEISSVVEDKNNHTIDALRYALSSFKREHPTKMISSSRNFFS